MRSITVGFSASTKKIQPFAKLIKWWDDTEYSHVYFKFHSVTYDVQMIYQASSTMLNYMSEDVFLLHNKVIEEINIDVSDEEYLELMKDCMESAGKEYGLMLVLGIFIADILNLTGNPFPDKNKFVCSGWIARRLEKLGYKFNKKINIVKPIDINKVLKNEG